jgi:hypothetical protein
MAIIFVIEYPNIAGHTLQNTQQSSTLDIPSMLTVQAQNGVLLNMNLIGIESIDPTQPIPISSFKWHIGSVSESEEGSSTENKAIHLKFCFGTQGTPDSTSSCWIRVAQPLAGKGWGGTFIPRIGQEVLVNFLEGDPDRPIVVGSVYNSNVIPTSSTTELSQSPQLETSVTPEKIQWDFKNLQTGESTCGGIDVKHHQLLDCQHIFFRSYTIPPGTTTIQVDTGEHQTLKNVRIVEGGNHDITTSQIAGILQDIPNIDFNPPATPIEATLFFEQHPVPSTQRDISLTITNPSSVNQNLEIGVIYN